MTAVAEHRAPSPSRSRRRSPSLRPIARRALALVATLVLLLTGLALLVMTAGPRVLHYRTATMLTGSMAPTIDPGDVVVDTAEPATSLAVGQIVSYHIPVDDHHVESHRVTWVHVLASGSVEFRTKGDANPTADPWTAQSSPHQQVWVVRHVLRRVGSVIRLLREPWLQTALTRVLPVLLVLSVLLAIWRPTNSTTEDE